MLRSIACLIFILTNSVMAQAAFPVNGAGASELSLQKWVPTYAGETEVDGLPVMAVLEESQGEDAPQFVAATPDAYAPSLLPVIRKQFRLNLIVSQNPRIQAVYPVEPKVVSLDGDIRQVYMSAANDPRGFQFVVTAEKDGTLHVMYSRKTSQGNDLHGAFVLASVMHTL